MIARLCRVCQGTADTGAMALTSTCSIVVVVVVLVVLPLASYGGPALAPYTLEKVENKGQFAEHKPQGRIGFNTSVRRRVLGGGGGGRGRGGERGPRRGSSRGER